MLKRLELIGFKSFADKTVFEFARGITAVVGPNGSGKSNIVDAVRWILGEQSAKSLRGGEMADVIFNGSSSRRSLGLAEVSLTCDNTKRFLSVDADEVRITRRVYRDGQGEYLINNQPSRLRDIKDLFLGSGAGQGAYSTIEQGRVDALLQASHKDRRLIFEEAAGISRFKARKIETLRKLEHVEQNLARSRDLLEELAKQLRSVQLQASKAQRYQEYSTRLKELRVGLGLQEYRDLTAQLQIETGVLQQLRAELERVSEEATATEQEAKRLDTELAGLEQQLRGQEAQLAQARQQIAAHETQRDYEAAASVELNNELARVRAQRGELTLRIAELNAQADQARGEWLAGEIQAEERREKVRELESALQSADAELEKVRAQVESDRAEHLERMRQATRLQNDVIGLRARLDNLRARRDGLRTRSAQAARVLESLDQELDDLLQSEAHVQQLLADARADLGKKEDERDDLRRQAEESQQRLSDLKVQRSGLASRVELLEQLERSQEGLGTGVREVLKLVHESQERDSGVAPDQEDWSFIVGLVADCLTVPRELAPMIDLALGEAAQFFLVRDSAKLDEMLQKRGHSFAGRVGFVPVRPPVPTPPASAVYAADEGQRADFLVRCEPPELAGLPTQLLANVRIVPDLATARAIAARPGSGHLRFVTHHGELLEADGTLTVGTHHAETGILSRKSELRELRQQAVDVDLVIAETEQEQIGLREQVEALEEPIFFLQQRIADLVEEAGEMRARVSQHREKRSGLHDEVALSRGEIDGLEQEIGDLQTKLTAAQQQAEESESLAQQIQARAEQGDRSARELEQTRQQREQECSQARVEQAQIDERLAAQSRRLTQLETDLAQRRRELAQFEQNEAATQIRIRDSLLAQLRASQALAESFVLKESAEAGITAFGGQREQVQSERRAAAERWQAAGDQRQEKWNDTHAHELRASELNMRIEGICQRLREDYQLELAELHGQAGPAPENTPRVDPVAAQQEIDDLRKKLTRLGAVNLEALQELNDLEKRITEKQSQHEDLSKSQQDLLSIINKINEDSRKLFADTFATIRVNFQDLFRKLFGGGMADVILEDEADILESGIEINARPPGKELRSISLLSGGERTLTAVALLLAIFRSKPSPFCLLDEVDAALDEANNSRLGIVLREFLDQSQFIVITHKKRTMAVADVLYGITMQEAGVSKQVSVRFEDWPDEAEQEARAAG